ncbi:beta-lactamase family protein [Dyadobacter sp. LJ53]|uniref:serine hydrolase domain-containing protein n=1 Tax=Dyadobacter chenwenxiniae TaxID=2906456 RepID=UPI001F416B25|nr:serine hydrolase domain-containing protein [Dyadobacter chenwenxiniae]MCF0052625.1 beta-lactamase family protein [Dyadobacter chenwenxiniae]
MARNITFFLLVLAFLLATLSTFPAVQAQEPVPKTLDELKARLESEMHRQHVAGMMLAIVDKDSVRFSGGLGLSDMGKRTPVTQHHLFRAASITKMFIALSILDLVKDKKLGITTKLSDIAPEIPFENKWETSNPVTIEMLLEHTTGFSDKSPFEEYNFTGKPVTGIGSVAVFGKFMKSRWKPGERHSYSSVNYAILDYIIEKVSGKPTSEYLRTKVFTPLQMPDANIAMTSDGSAKYSKGYVWKDDHFQLVPHQPAFNPGYSSLNVSALDLAFALKAYLNDWNTHSGPFLSAKFLNESETPHTYLSARAGLMNTYGYGNEASDIAGHIFRGHRGAIGGFLSAFLYNRKLGLGYAFAINTHNESFYRYADHLISQFVLQHVQKPVMPVTYPLNKAVAQPFMGYYKLSNPIQLYTGFFESLTNTIKVEQVGNELSVQILGRGSMKWQAADAAGIRYKSLYAANPQILFLKDAEGNHVIVDGTLYFEKTTAFAAWASLLGFAVSVLFLVSTLFFLLINLLLIVAGKIPRGLLVTRFSPTLVAIGSVLMLWSASHLFDHMREASSTDWLFMMWGAGKYLFAAGILLVLYVLSVKWRAFSSKGLKAYLVMVAISACYLFFIFVSSNWYY